ncbi:F-box/LRR-repeat protein [Citrus sinensis]|uniref:F-box/LRR-repeat protein n=1 Tax=Citrus sinensis TaxID=2711 RepID=A0ACB8JVQ9_CITSI|nr:F-box/LRR-repeat protein [Citrus sinensis]
MDTESHSSERNSTSLEEDRISCLPDEILCHILSFLPTKNAVATCVLSSKWRLVWALLPNLCFDDRLCLMYENTRALTEDASTRLTLELVDCAGSDTELEVVIRAPNLEYLYINDYLPISYMVDELHSLTKAVIDIDCEYIGEFQSIDAVAQGVVQLLRGVNNTKFLSWAKGILYALVFARQIEDFFPTFPFLTRFALVVDDSGWHLLPLIFSRMPNLESFVFEVDEDTDFDCWWAEEPLSLPDCLLPHVKRIEMRGFAGRKNELKLIKFLLKNCEVLNTMIIKFQKKRVQKMVLMEKLCKKLSVFRRVSKTCQIIVL